MNIFIELETITGSKSLTNLKNISRVIKDDEGKAVIEMTNSMIFYVKDSYEDILNMINEIGG